MSYHSLNSVQIYDVGTWNIGFLWVKSIYLKVNLFIEKLADLVAAGTVLLFYSHVPLDSFRPECNVALGWKHNTKKILKVFSNLAGQSDL